MADEITGTGMFSQANQVSISVTDLAFLQERDRELTLLEFYGVDNWAGYYDAINNVEEYDV